MDRTLSPGGELCVHFNILFHRLCLLAHEVICSGVAMDHLCCHFIRIRSGPAIKLLYYCWATC